VNKWRHVFLVPKNSGPQKPLADALMGHSLVRSCRLKIRKHPCGHVNCVYAAKTAGRDVHLTRATAPLMNNLYAG